MQARKLRLEEKLKDGRDSRWRSASEEPVTVELDDEEIPVMVPVAVDLQPMKVGQSLIQLHEQIVNKHGQFNSYTLYMVSCPVPTAPPMVWGVESE